MAMRGSETTFYRPVRNYPESLPQEAFQLQSPPNTPQKQSGGAMLLQFLYPLSGILMTIVMVTSTTLSGGSSNLLLIIIESAIIPFSIIIMFLSTYIQRRTVKQAHNVEKQGYKGYLENVKRRLNEIVKLQTLYYARLYPDPQRLLELAMQRQVLWERRPSDEDFLSTRVGLAPTTLCCQVTFQEDYKANYTPGLLQDARDLVTRYSHVDAQPLVIPLGQLGTISVTGPRQAVTALVRALLAEIVTFHAASEVRIVGYFPTYAALEWSWLKWTPHTRRLRPVQTLQPGDPEMYSMLADSIESLQIILETQIGPELEQRHKFNEEKKTPDSSQAAQRARIPHLLVILDNYTHSGPLSRVPGLEELMGGSEALGITVLCLCPTQDDEPSLTKARLSLTPFIGSYQLSYKETALGGRELEFVRADNLDVQQCESLVRSMTPLQLIDREAEIDFSQSIGLLDLHHVPALETFDVRQLWQTLDEKQLLRVPIGIQKGGALLLDLKEMAMGGYGPHGLVVGATGSGKSELLRTVVTSLALTHDPYMLNFVLVDFKAGAAFADFEGLPHMAGMITNLENDPQLINRMYASLLGEQQRRQNMLSRAGNLANIRQYQAKWHRNPEMEPMPYLLIIVDEFAQLIATYEDFLALFVKFGQVGRSLGMHMMLATQRIEEGRIRSLEGHLRYRIGLRTFKPDESTAVIGRPDAYYLPPSPGSGYFKVDEDIYAGFKTALISTPYVSPEKKQVNPLDLVCEFTATGQLRPCQVPLTHAGEEEEEVWEERTEMTMVVERIAQVPPPQNGWRVHAVWQPPLSEQVPLDLVLKKCGVGMLDGSHWPHVCPLGQLCVPIGMMDRPTEQTQVPLILDFSSVGGHLAIVGAPQSGKSMLLRTLLAALIVTHTPRDVQIYGIDFGGGQLRIFEGAPHVGAICSRAARDKMRRVLRRLRQVLTEREALFGASEIDSMAAYRQQRLLGKLNEQEFGDVFLVIDNFGQMRADFEASDGDIINDIGYLIANGLALGVHVVLATNVWSEIRPSNLRANLGSRLELRLNDPADSEIERRLAATLPARAPGRGLHPSKLVFQAALPIVKGEEALSDLSVQQALEDLVLRVRSAWHGPVAPPIRILPTEVPWSDLPLPSAAEPSGVPLGLDELRQAPFYLDMTTGDAHRMILGDRECGKTTLLRTWMRGLALRFTPEQAQIILIDYRKTLADFQRNASVLAYAFTPDQAKEAVALVKVEMEKRLAAGLQSSEKQSGQAWSGPHYYVVIDDYEGVATGSPQTSNPLNPLEGFLVSGLEIGFHMFLARRVTELGRVNFDPIFKGVKNMEAPGLLMRGDPGEGRQALHKQNISGELPTGRASYVTRNAPPTLIQVARSDA